MEGGGVEERIGKRGGNRVGGDENANQEKEEEGVIVLIAELLMLLADIAVVNELV